MKPVIGDRTLAIALEIAERRLIKLGWKYSNADVGEAAAVMINALQAHLKGGEGNE